MITPCPRCSAALTGSPTCAACGLPLTGPSALALWQVDQRISDVDRRIAGLGLERQRLWSEHVRLVVTLSADPSIPAPPAPPAPPWAVDATRRPLPSFPAHPAAPVRPKQEWTPRRVQNLLLTIGALLVVIAGAIFTAVSWRHLGAAVRGSILLALTGGAAVGARTLARRGLTATAEAVSAICVGLTAFDAYAVHALLLPHVAGYAYWAAATAALAAASAGLGRLTNVRLPWVAAAALILLPPVVLCAADLSSAGRGVLLSLDAVVAAAGLVGLRRTGSTGQTVNDVRTCWSAGAAVLWTLGFVPSAGHVAYGLRGQSLGLVLAALALTAAAAAGAALSTGQPSARTALAGATALSVVGCLSLPFEARLDPQWWALAVIIATAAVVLGSAALPAIWRAGPAVAAAAAAAVAGATALPSVASTLAGQLSWIGRPWSSARSVGQLWAGPANVLALLCCGVVAVAAGRLLDRRSVGDAVAAALGTIVALVAVPQLGGAYDLGLGVDVTVVLLAATAAVVIGRRSLLAGRVATIAAVVATVVSLGWSLAVPSATATVAVALVLLTAAAATAGAPHRPVWAATAVGCAGVAAAALAHVGHAPVAALGLAVAGVPLAVTVGLAVAARWFGGHASRTADALELASAVVAIGALTLATRDNGWASWTLLAVAAAGLMSTVRADRRVGAPFSVALALVALTTLPFAQQLSVPAVTALCVALAAASLAGGCAAALLGTTELHRQVGGVLVAGSVAQAAIALSEAQHHHEGLTAVLAALCLVYAGVATLPDRLFTLVAKDFRAVGTGVTAALLLATVASGCTDRGMEAPVTGLVVGLAAALLAVGATLLKDRQPDSSAVELVSAFAALVALRTCADRPVLAGWLLAATGLTVLVSATRPDRRAWWPAGAALIAAATWVWLAVAGVSSPEPYTDPIAALALYVGFARRRAQPATASVTAYGPGLAGLLLPSLVYALVGAGLERPLLLAALATAVVIVGAQHRLRAPLVLGSATLVMTALRLLAPYEVLIPRWLDVGTAGAVLLTLGATYEQRRRNLGALRTRYDALL